MAQGTVEAQPLGLAGRESQVLGLMAAGLSNGGIAATLCVSPKTVEHHIARIFTKLELRDAPEVNRRVQAVLRYLG